MQPLDRFSQKLILIKGVLRSQSKVNCRAAQPIALIPAVLRNQPGPDQANQIPMGFTGTERDGFGDLTQGGGLARACE